MFYVDKSPFLRYLEGVADIAALLRPQRWGKTVFLQTVSAYYDVAHKHKPLVTIPGGPTPLAHSFSILHLDLASVASVDISGSQDKMRQDTTTALDMTLQGAVTTFVDRYPAAKTAIDTKLPPALLLERLASWAKAQGAPLYVLVDEYDALLRTLAVVSGDHATQTLAGSQGPLREFFGRFKSLHGKRLLPRMFITGISPVGLDAMTSAFNCAIDISGLKTFNEAIGFTEVDVRRAIVECLGYAAGSPEQQHILETLQLWGNGYRFAAELGPSAGMFQTAMVTQLLMQLQAHNSPIALAGATLKSWLSAWTPSGAVGNEPEEQVVAYFTRSGAMDTLLPKLVASPRLHIEAPAPLSKLRVEQQLAAARAPGAKKTRPQVLLSNWARFDAELACLDGIGSLAADAHAPAPPAQQTPAEKTLVRTMYFEGLLTHAAGDASGGGGGGGGSGLQVPNQAMRGRFVHRFADALGADKRKKQAVDAFLLRGKTGPLLKALADVCRHGLTSKVLESWSEYHYAERLVLLLSTSPATNFSWRREEPLQRVYRSGGIGYTAFADIVGRSGSRTIIIEVKQVNPVFDLASDSPQLAQEVEAAAARIRKQRARRDERTVLELAKAETLAHLQEDALMDVVITKPTSTAKRRTLTVGELVEEAAVQAQQYARGWQLENGRLPHSMPELYSAVAVGPLRWLLQRVSLAT